MIGEVMVEVRPETFDHPLTLGAAVVASASSFITPWRASWRRAVPPEPALAA